MKRSDVEVVQRRCVVCCCVCGGGADIGTDSYAELIHRGGLF